MHRKKATSYPSACLTFREHPPNVLTVHHKTTIEPFRIKVVEQIKLTTEEERRGFLKEAQFEPVGN